MLTNKAKLAATTAATIAAFTLGSAGLVHAQVQYDSSGAIINPSSGLNAANDGTSTSAGTGGTAAVGTTSATGTPGIPNTGTGGNASSTIVALIASALGAIGGTYLLRRRADR